MAGDFFGQFDQFVRLVSTRTHDDDDVIPPAFCFNRAAGCGTDFFRVGHTGATKLLDNDCHVLRISCDVGPDFVGEA